MNKFLLKTLLLASVFGVISCTKMQRNISFEGVDTTNAVTGDWLVMHELSDPQRLNPYTASDASAQKIYQLIFESMLYLDPEKVELVPNLAESMPVLSDDHLTYTFVLKKNIKFSDGKPLTAKDVIFSFKALKNPLILDAASLRGYFIDVEDVTALDDYTVIVKMLKPSYLALYSLGTDLRIIPKHVLDPKGLTDKYTFAETNDIDLAEKNAALKEFADWFGKVEIGREAPYLVGSGPYIMENWRTEEYVKIKRNPNYWNGKNNKWAVAHADRLVFKTVNDRTSAVSAMKNGDLDFMDYVPPRMFDELLDTAATPYLKKVTYNIPTYMYIGWNTRRAVFKDKRVRQALSHLVDRDMLVKNVMLGYATTINGPVPQTRPEYNTDMKPYEYNPARSKELLKEAGWVDTDGNGILDKMIDGKKVEFTFNILLNAGNETRENIAVILVNEFKKVGIRAGIQRLEWSVFLENLDTYQFDAMIGAWVNDPTPPDLYQLWHTTQAVNKGSNYPGFGDARTDKIIEDIRVEFDDAKRTALLKEIQAIIHEEQPYTFLWVMQYPAVYHKRIQGANFYAPRPGYVLPTFWVPRKLQVYD
jgi:peptide/nickel transport system substrate-binding protein